MTNGEKIVNTFHGKVSKTDGVVYFTTGGWIHAYDDEWWNSEYKEPTKNDSEIDIAIKIIKADDLAPYSVEDILKARDLAVEALKQMRTAKNDLGVDCVPRQAVIDLIQNSNADLQYYFENEEVCNDIRALPSVTPQLSVPEVTALAEWTEKLTKASEDAYNKGYADGMKAQEPKTGEWIEHFDESGKWYECDQCHTDWGGAVNFCPDCGADMREVEE